MNEDKLTNQDPDEPTNPAAQTRASDPVPVAAEDSAGRSTSGRKRNLLIGTAAAVALLAVGGSAYAIGANIGDDDHDGRTAVAGDHPRAGSGIDGDDDGADGDTSITNLEERGSKPAATVPALRAAAEKAIARTSARGVTSIDVEHGGYEVELQLADGRESEVFVTADGAVSTGSDRPDEDRPDPLLDLARLEAISQAALSAVSTTGGAHGSIDSIGTTDDRGVGYEVSIRLPGHRDAEVELAGDLSVLTTDIDDD